MSAAFEAAEHLVGQYFADRTDSPERGTIEIHGERYVLVRAAALSVEFFALVRGLYGESRAREADEFARNILFDLAHAIGKSDARAFHHEMKVTDPIERLSAGPVHFAYTGWALVEISAESRPTPDEEFYLLYDHPYSFEASAWSEHADRAAFPVCVMNAGYSSGWCSESFGVNVVATEILCRARGDDSCRFVMAHPDRIEQLVERYRELRPELRLGDYQIPDLFTRKKIEEADRRLLQAHKLEAIGRLAGGIAHDFNNLLATILMRAARLDTRLGREDATIARELDQIRFACERGGELSRQLLAFGKRQPVTRAPLELGQLVRDLERTLLPLVGEHVEVVTTIHRAAHIEADRSQLEQVLMNLVVNARDAMPEGGFVKLEVDLVELAGRRVTTGPLLAGTYATLSVADTGTGMDPETIARVFDPYFTTKGEGRGTGLGLSTVYGIVEQAGGGIALDSEPGKGTRFTLYFPAAGEPMRAEPAAPPASVAPSRRLRILLVEDEPEVRHAIAEILDETHEVVAVDSGAAALDMLDATAAPFDLLLTDLVMPRLSGRELARLVRTRRPELRILFMSGYDREQFADPSSEPVPAAMILHKPFTAEELTRKIDEVAQEPANSKR